MPEMADSAAVAERVMYELLGRRWVWPPLRALEEYDTNQRNIHVRGRPIREVHSVTIAGKDLDPSDWVVKNWAVVVLPKRLPNLLWASRGWVWTGDGSLGFDPLNPNWCNREIIVDYTYGAEAPKMVKDAISKLATELDLAFNGDMDACRLPSRVVSVASRGIEMTLLDSMDFLEDGMTGIPEVDLTISIFNPGKARKRARVFSPGYRPGRRLTTGGS